VETGVTAAALPCIAAFPKCYLETIARERSMTVFEWIEEARGLPVDGLELYEGFLLREDDDYVDAVGEAIADAGFEMPMMCCSPDLSHPDPSVRRREIERELRMIAITARLGGSSCRVLTGQRHPGVGVEEGLEQVVGAIEELLPAAREHGVRLALENHYKDGHWLYPEFAQQPDVFLRVLDGIEDREHFGVQFDPSNATVAGVDPVELLRAVAPRVITMHASDRYLEPGHSLESLRQADGTIGYTPHLRHGVVGQGLNDFESIFRILAGCRFDGWISIEDGMNGIDEIRASAVFLREAVARAFAGDSDATTDD
jgi:sugar phosphate isomerase/epimerase